jgi:hypothetical protein
MKAPGRSEQEWEHCPLGRQRSLRLAPAPVGQRALSAAPSGAPPAKKRGPPLPPDRAQRRAAAHTAPESVAGAGLWDDCSRPPTLPPRGGRRPAERRSSLRQAQHPLTKAIVALTVGVPLHRRAPFLPRHTASASRGSEMPTAGGSLAQACSVSCSVLDALHAGQRWLRGLGNGERLQTLPTNSSFYNTRFADR